MNNFFNAIKDSLSYFIEMAQQDPGIGGIQEKYFPEYLFHDGVEHGIITFLTGIKVIPNDKDLEQSNLAEELVIQLRDQFEELVFHDGEGIIVTLKTETEKEYFIPKEIAELYKKLSIYIKVRELQDYGVIPPFYDMESALSYFENKSFSSLKEELEKEEQKLMNQF